MSSGWNSGNGLQEVATCHKDMHTVYIHNREFGRLLVDALKSKQGLSSTHTHTPHIIQTPMGQKVFTLVRSPF